MAETITYQYNNPSAFTKDVDSDELFLSRYSEVQKRDATCFFWGQLKDPYTTARCLITLSNVVQSSFNLSPFQMALLKDPIVTAGNEKIVGGGAAEAFILGGIAFAEKAYQYTNDDACDMIIN